MIQFDLSNSDIILGANWLRPLGAKIIVECLISYNFAPITIGGIIVPEDMIQFDLFDFDIILGMN